MVISMLHLNRRLTLKKFPLIGLTKLSLPLKTIDILCKTFFSMPNLNSGIHHFTSKSEEFTSRIVYALLKLPSKRG